MILKNARYFIETNGTWSERQEDLLIEGNTIQDIGNLEPLYGQHEVWDVKDYLILPGLVNGHQHTPMSLLRCYSDDLPLMEWLNKKMLPAEMKMTSEDRYWGAMLSIAEMIKSGTTAYADMYIDMDTIAAAVQETGIRASLSRGMIAMDSNYSDRIEESRNLVKKWHKQADGRITVMIAPHSPYMCPPDFLRDAVNLAKELDVPLHTHLAETADERNMIQERHGMSPVQYLQQAGFFDHTSVNLAHGVHFTEDDLSILGGLTGGIIHNPVSNAKLACGTADLVELAKGGIKVGLGTDGPGSASTLDMFMEMKAAAWMQKLLQEDASALTAHEILTMATKNGAEILGIGQETGSIEVGKKADLLFMNMNQPHLVPAHQNPSLLVYAAAGQDVDSVMVDGKLIMKHRELLTMDEEKVMFEAKRCAEDLIARI
ncbi:5-methylthioadenosine/S-adenosylhomocysteine deaminase [Fictibacillus solisalsi]|uniref:5-methylthioadenosine/S-adenosylhomocysteine deaminase n=1 Tax=Fictibacillus solisalsi TaxID=459525 RepID=A0A1H0B8H2_9BACL|nr:amidohydrolase [Fictibacillus solisalsi]SDN41929.1 5-methylthioadenosine/S-adenosylhomocysteine deaminase [Fictibacillus solisalsi]